MSNLNIPVKIIFVVFAIFRFTLVFSQAPKQALTPTGLSLNLLYAASKLGDKNSPLATKSEIPVAIENRRLAFSWMLSSSKENITQTAYQLLLADDLKKINAFTGNLWNSGRVNSRYSSGILYDAQTLLPGHQYFWRVKIWDNTNQPSSYSNVCAFKTAATLNDSATERYRLVANEQLPVTVHQRNGFTVADFGKDAFAQLKLRLSSGTQADTVIVRLGELLNADGTINRKPPGTIRFAEYSLPLQKGSKDYLLKIRQDKRNTGPDAIKMPDYIGEVTPFRYCEIEGYKKPLAKGQLIRIAVNYPFDEQAARFSSSDTILNQVWDLCKYSVKATTFAGVYIDGDRERIPYEADAYINQLSHYAVDNEYSLARYSHEYLINKPTWPTEWILQSVLMAFNDYMYTGDLRSAGHFYNDLVAKTLLPLEDSTGLISVKTVPQQVLQSIHFRSGRPLEDIVDWPHTGILGLGKQEGGETDGFVFTDHNAVSNAYHYKALLCMKELSAALGKTADAALFQQKAASFRETYHRLLWDEKRGVYCDGISTRHASLHTNMFALLFGLVDEDGKAGVLTFIQSRGMACSVYGSQFLLDAVYDNGGENYGLNLLTDTTDRSWYNMIRLGSTLTLEAWDNKYKPNLDWNHVWGAAPANIISRKLMGIEPLSPGWTEFTIRPRPAGLSRARITVPTIKGSIEMSFEKKENSFLLKTQIPANTKAQVFIPVNPGNSFRLTMDGKEISPEKTGNSLHVRDVGSGPHSFLLTF